MPDTLIAVAAELSVTRNLVVQIGNVRMFLRALYTAKDDTQLYWSMPFVYGAFNMTFLGLLLDVHMFSPPSFSVNLLSY
jgi:hypothetical protein